MRKRVSPRFWVWFAVLFTIAVGVFLQLAGSLERAAAARLAAPVSDSNANSGPVFAESMRPVAPPPPVHELFTIIRPTNAAELNALLPVPAGEVGYVTLNAHTLHGKGSAFWRPAGEGRVRVPLPDGGSLDVVVDRSEMVAADQFITVGKIAGRPLSRVVFAGSGPFLNGSIQDPELGTFVLATANEAVAQFYRVDASRIPGCSTTKTPHRLARAASDTAGIPFVPPNIFAAAADNPQRAVIHVLMVHTRSVLPTLSGNARTQALQSAFLAAIEKVNDTFDASQITARVKLVGVHETTWAGDASADPQKDWQDESLTALYTSGDGQMDEVHAVRDRLGADVVCMALQRGDTQSSGLSFLLDDPARFDNAEYAFAVVQYGHIAGTNVVAHEFGHVLGCAHDRENAKSGEGAYPYSFGYRFLGADRRQYRDIMSYDPGIELRYFSNPRITLPAPVSAALGIGEGRAGESDTARTIEQTAVFASNFRLQTQAAVSPGVLVNVATRAFVGRDEQVLIGGFVVSGTQAKRVLVRGAGPALAAFGVSDALRDPVLRIFTGSTRFGENDNWSGSEVEAAAVQTAAFPFARGSDDAALVGSFTPGAYTVILEGKGGQTGVGLIEAYDLEPGPAQRVVNLATRGFANKGGREMIGGFVVQGVPGETKRILIRVLGPTLSRAPFNLTGVLEDPMLELKNSAGELLIENDDWSSDAQGGVGVENDFKPVVVTYKERQIFETGHAPGNRREPCLLVDLPPGSYSVIVKPFELRSSNLLLDQPAVPGVGIIEVYEIGR